jgi:hypothetical protein
MLSQPNRLLFLIGALLIAISFFLFRKTLDLHVYDTYYVIALNFVCWVLAAFLLLFGLLYSWTGSLMFSTILTWTHVAFTIILAVFVVTTPYWIQMVEQTFSNDPFAAIKQRERFHRGLRLLCMLLLAGQITYFINLFGGLIKRYS